MVKVISRSIVALAIVAAGSSLISETRADSLQPSSLFAAAEPVTLALVGTALLAISRAAARVPATGFSRRAAGDPPPARFALEQQAVRPARAPMTMDAATVRGNVEEAA